MFAQKITHLGTAFRQYFEIVPAFTEALQQEAYRIRHAVYCEDLQFEATRSDGFETDEYDAHSLHLLIRNTQLDRLIGCVRVIIPPTDGSDWLLPFEKTCANTLNRSIIDPAKLPRKQIAEVSRLAVISSFRRRKGEANSPVSLTEDDFDHSPAPRFPYIPLGLYYGAVELARLHGVKLLFILTEERLANHFNKLGFEIQFIGAPTEHHGQRFPSMFSIDKTIQNIRPAIYPLYQTIAEDIKAGLEGNDTSSIMADESKSIPPIRHTTSS